MKVRFSIDRLYHQLFQVGVLVKGLNGVLELMSACLLFLVPTVALNFFANFLFYRELIEDPRDLLAHGILKLFAELSGGTQQFVVLYLFVHGGLKLFLAVQLLREKLWAFPVGIGLLSLFNVYQLFRYSFTHSSLLLAFILLDVVMIVLIWFEWRHRRAFTL